MLGDHAVKLSRLNTESNRQLTRLDSKIFLVQKESIPQLRRRIRVVPPLVYHNVTHLMFARVSAIIQLVMIQPALRIDGSRSGYSPVRPCLPAILAWSSFGPLLLDPRVVDDDASSGRGVLPSHSESDGLRNRFCSLHGRMLASEWTC